MTDNSGTALAQRMSLLGWSLVLVPGAVLGAVLATLWITSISIAAFGVGIPLTLLATVLVRWFADLHRQWAADRLGEPVPARPISRHRTPGGRCGSGRSCATRRRGGTGSGWWSTQSPFG
ncbi:sensor domain-containing protein [Micromonospora sp. M12]